MPYIIIYNLYKVDGSSWASIHPFLKEAGPCGSEQSRVSSLLELILQVINTSRRTGQVGMPMRARVPSSSILFPIFTILKDSFLAWWRRLQWSIVSFSSSEYMDKSTSKYSRTTGRNTSASPCSSASLQVNQHRWLWKKHTMNADYIQVKATDSHSYGSAISRSLPTWRLGSP